MTLPTSDVWTYIHALLRVFIQQISLQLSYARIKNRGKKIQRTPPKYKQSKEENVVKVETEVIRGCGWGKSRRIAIVRGVEARGKFNYWDHVRVLNPVLVPLGLTFKIVVEHGDAFRGCFWGWPICTQTGIKEGETRERVLGFKFGGWDADVRHLRHRIIQPEENVA